MESFKKFSDLKEAKTLSSSDDKNQTLDPKWRRRRHIIVIGLFLIVSTIIVVLGCQHLHKTTPPTLTISGKRRHLRENHHSNNEHGFANLNQGSHQNDEAFYQWYDKKPTKIKDLMKIVEFDKS